MQQEIELKLSIRAEQVPLLQASQVIKDLAVEAMQVRQLKNFYYDTPALELSQMRFALRTRNQDGHWEQTLKNSGHVLDGLHERSEWEWPLASAALDLSLLPQAVKEHIDALDSALEVMFEVHFQRDVWQLETQQGTKIEMVLDRGEVLVGSWAEPISEVELELKSGNADDLFAVAKRLQQELELVPFDVSKAARGYRMVRAIQQNKQAADAE